MWQLWVNVFSIHDKSKIYIYHEKEANKSLDEICSFLQNYIDKDISNTVKHLIILFSDGPSGKNNKTIIVYKHNFGRCISNCIIFPDSLPSYEFSKSTTARVPYIHYIITVLPYFSFGRPTVYLYLYDCGYSTVAKSNLWGGGTRFCFSPFIYICVFHPPPHDRDNESNLKETGRHR